MNSEQKTSNYLETNLASVDHSATSNLGILESDSHAGGLVGTDRPVKTSADWLFCVKRRWGLMRKLLSVFVGISLMALIYFFISSLLTSSYRTRVLMLLLLVFFTEYFHVLLTLLIWWREYIQMLIVVIRLELGKGIGKGAYTWYSASL